MKNASINIISSRTKCLESCLTSLWENHNNFHDYDVNVYYFDDVYDSIAIREKITANCPQRVNFIRVEYNSPVNVPESEMFYNQPGNQYARSFGVARKGYLHMCNFVSNIYVYPGTLTCNYKYTIIHDDESGYTRRDCRDLTTVLQRSGHHIGAFFVGQRLKNGAPHQGHLDTRVGLWEITKEFILENQIVPANLKLRELLDDEPTDAEWNFHFLDWCDTYVIDNALFETQLWKKWIKKINDSGGIYKHRWGDNEIISLFSHMIQENIVNLGLVESGTHDQGMFRHLQDIAPGVKDPTK